MIEHIRPKYACQACEANVVIADVLPEPIDKGLPGPGLLAYVAVSKYADHLPLYRLEGIFQRSGVEISRSTMCDCRTGAHGLALLPCLAILAAQVSWSLGTVLSKNFALPTHKGMSAAGQMITGGAFLLIASGFAGELRPWPHLNRPAALALLYLIVAGSILAFTAYTWLLGRMSATKVSSYAYVNPVIALGIGYWFGGEALTLEIFIGAALVLASVILLLMKQPTTH